MHTPDSTAQFDAHDPTLHISLNNYIHMRPIEDKNMRRNPPNAVSTYVASVGESVNVNLSNVVSVSEYFTSQKIPHNLA